MEQGRTWFNNILQVEVSAQASTLHKDTYASEMGGVRKIDSKPDPARKIKTPNPDPVRLQIFDSDSGCAHLCHAFTYYIPYYLMHTESEFGFFPKIQIGIRLRIPKM